MGYTEVHTGLLTGQFIALLGAVQVQNQSTDLFSNAWYMQAKGCQIWPFAISCILPTFLRPGKKPTVLTMGMLEGAWWPGYHPLALRRKLCRSPFSQCVPCSNVVCVYLQCGFTATELCCSTTVNTSTSLQEAVCCTFFKNYLFFKNNHVLFKEILNLEMSLCTFKHSMWTRTGCG